MNTCNAKRPCFITTTRPPPSTGHTTTLAHTLAHTMAARQEQVAEVLQVVLQRLSQPDDWDLRTLCSLLLVSTACRKAVFDSGASCSLSPKHFRSADSDSSITSASLQRVMGFAAWLPNHTPLVSSLELHAPDSEADAAMAEQVLTLAVKLCAAQQQQQQQALLAQTPSGLVQPLSGLRLQSLTGNMLLQPAALAALACCSHLTCLKWQRLPHTPSAGTLRGLGQLTGLSNLYIYNASGEGSDRTWEGLTAALGHLRQLQQLHCSGKGILTLASMRQLPASLTYLVCLPLEPLESAEVPQVLDLGHLTALKKSAFRLWFEDMLPCVVPASLTWLRVEEGCIDMAPGLCNLVHLELMVDFTEPCLLQHVHAMPQLRTLGLSLGQWADEPLTAEDVQAVAQGVAAATQVTHLELIRYHWDVMEVGPLEGDVALLLCSSLQQLRQLDQLHVEGICLDSMDVLGWTALSALSSLCLVRCSGVTDIAAAALGCKLTGLKCLALVECGLTSPVLWPALACCSGLIQLDLASNELPLVDGTLLLLTSLTQLALLVLPASASDGPSAAAIQQFKAAMPQLTSLVWD